MNAGNLESGNVYNGKVKFFNVSKGYGFITDTDTVKDYFVHFTGCVDRIKDNDLVSFSIQEGDRGVKAVNVILKG